MRAIPRLFAALALVVLLALAGGVGHAGAAGLAWRLEQPPPPEGGTPIPLGHVGDIEFDAPNLGLVITAGNGSTIKPGLWAYTGKGWHELSIVCGASDGRIAWAGPDEFWTISDGRPGQAAGPLGELPPLEDDTLCRFANGSVVESFATLAFQANSYEPMHAAGCIDPSDCWFAGDPLPEPLAPGAFHLHWNGHAMTAQPDQEGHGVHDMRLFDGHLYESVQLLAEDREPSESPELGKPSALHRIEPANNGSPFKLIFNSELELPKPGIAFEFLHLGAGPEALWAAAGPSFEGETSAQVTVVRCTPPAPPSANGSCSEGEWQQLIGAKAEEEAKEKGESRGEPIPTQDAVTAIAAEPGGGGAWIALDTPQDAETPSPNARALIAHVSANGTVSEEQELPGAGTPRGAAAKLAC
ncbi:MAG TPA: hypothetical protein VKG38_01805, partial [Solirubrobacteraceae bacterium]|nr:hypothetical protein [Solirubrobacteraceae bacterium]